MAADSSGARQNVSFASNGGQAHGYLATPPSGSGPPVVVIQEWWGLTSHIAAVTDRLAAEGFVALAPDLYGGSTTHDADEAGEMMQKLPPDRAARDLAGAVDFLLARDDVVGDQVGVVGFCMGGAFALTLGVQQGARVGAVVAFYPVGQLPSDYAGLSAGVLLQLAEQDAFHPIDEAEKMAGEIAATSTVSPRVEKYPGGHAFHNDDDLVGTYDADLARRAWSTAVDFLKEHLA
jgi:carboxymethylenebutenolidase